MTTLVEWHGAGLTDESAITAGTAGTGDTAVGQVIGSDVKVETSDTKTPMVRFTQTTGGGCNLYWTVTSSTQGRIRCYFKTPAAWPTTSYAVCGFKSATTTDIARLMLGGTGAPGQARLTNTSSTAVYSSANGAIALSTVYRAELQVDCTAGTARLQVYLGESTTALLDSGSVASTYSTAFARIFIGNIVSTPTVTQLVGHLTATDVAATPLGIYPPAATGPVVSVVGSGSVETAAVVKVVASGSEVAGTLTLT